MSASLDAGLTVFIWLPMSRGGGGQAVHLGGALQLLFGLRGRRWEDPAYGADPGAPKYDYFRLFNDAWMRPERAETVSHASRVEGGCYW